MAFYAERLGTIQEQAAVLVSIPSILIAQYVAHTLFPSLDQIQIGSAAWHAESHLVALMFLCVGIAAMCTRILTTRGERWQYRIASPLGGVFVIGGIGMQAAFLGFDFGRTEYEAIALTCTFVLISGFLVWVNRSHMA